MANTSMENNQFEQWFYSPRNGSNIGKIKLFCFPYAGAGPSAYNPISQSLPDDIVPFVLRLPGRDITRKAKPLFDIREMAKAVSDIIRPLLDDSPVVFWGHSMGTLLAYETALLLRGDFVPDLLVVSGHQAPHISSNKENVKVEDLNDAQFVSLIKTYGGTPDVIFENQDLLDVFLPQLRSDFIAMDNYLARDEKSLDCNILAINGMSDHIVSEDDAWAWKKYTHANFKTTFLPGGHFFIYEQKKEVLDEILSTISEDQVLRAVE